MASSISILGSYSGIDQTTIDQLMEVERQPLTLLQNKLSSYTEEKNAWNDINTRLNNLYEKIKVLQSEDTFTSKNAISTDEDVVSMTADNDAAEGVYKIHVEQLATNTSIISGDISLAGGDIYQELGIEGQFTVENQEGDSVVVEIDAEDSIKTIANKINEGSKDTGIVATIIDSRLILTDSSTGDRDITLVDDVNSTLDKLGFGESERTVNQGVNSKFTINGIEVERSSNSVSDVVEYVTIDLKKEHEDGQFDTVEVRLDTSKIAESVQGFVDQYNSTMSFIEEKLESGDPEAGTSGGALAGDGTLMRLQSYLRTLITSAIDNDNTTINDISQLGVTTVDKYGQLQFDSAELTSAIEDDLDNVINFFTSEDDSGEEIGFVTRVNDYINMFIVSGDGVIEGKTESLSNIIDDINDQIEVFNERMETKEQQYIEIFASLDIAMMEAESQMSWLTQQLESL